MDKKTWFALYIVVIAAIGGTLYGYDIGIIAGALLFIPKSIAMSPDQMSLLVAAVLGGGAFATLVSGALADWFGRRRMIMISSIIFLIGVFCIYSANSYAILLTGRLLQGIGVGFIIVAIPLYLSESLPPQIRGRGMSAFQLFLTAGILLANLISLYFVPTGNWRGMFLSAMVPGFILLIGSIFLPNSPRWLFLKGRHAEVLAVLEKTRSSSEACAELSEMQSVINNAQGGIGVLLKSLAERRYRVPLLIAFAVAILNQLTGINSLLQFSAVILKSSGLSSNIVAMLGSSAITGMNFAVTVVAIFLIDKLGRKFLLSIGTAGVTLSLLACGAIFHYMDPSVIKGYLLLAGILSFILFFAIGPGVVVWLALSELLPSRVRSIGLATALFLNSLVSAILAGVFMSLVAHLGYAGTFSLCGGFTFIYFLLALFGLPETKNKTLEQIEAHFANL